MTNRPVDGVVRQLVSHDLATSRCVEAGAGTGKTALLVDRLARIVVSGAARLTQVAAITFTEKAARELRERLGHLLYTQLAAPEVDRIARVRLERAAGDLEGAAVTTIHGLCARILRDYVPVAGLVPGFRILDEAQERRLFDEAWEAWLAGSAAGDEDSPLARGLRSGLTLDRVRQFAADRYRHRDARPAPGAAGGREALGRKIASWTAEFRQEAEELWQLARRHCTDPSDRGHQALVQLRRDAATLAGLGGGSAARFILRQCRVSPAGNQGNWDPAEACKEQKRRCRRLRESLEEVRAAIGHHLATDLGRWVDDFLRHLETLKQRRGVAGFDDLLLVTGRLLREDPAARRDLQRRFRFILVDEFQDTDPLQAEIVFFLAEAEAEASRWEEVRLAPGKLLLVGDPKQSIYRFRRADTAVYRAARRALAGQGRVDRIITNFRSCPPLIDWVNETFSRLMVPDAGDTQPDYVDLAPHRPTTQAGPRVLFLEPRQADLPDDFTAPDLRDWEARATATCLAAALDPGSAEPAVIVDPLGGRSRPAGPGDVAVLFPTTTDVGIYEQALLSQGLPCRLEGGRRYLERPEIRGVVETLAAAADPANTLAAAAALRSPVFGCTDVDLWQHVQAGGDFNCRRDQPPGRAAACLEVVRRLHDRRLRLSPGAAVEWLQRETGLPLLSRLVPGGAQIAVNLDHLSELAAGWDGDLLAFTRHLEGLLSEDSPLPEPTADTGPGGKIRLMTVHGAKGLQFPVVVLAGLAAQHSPRTPRLIVDRRNGTYEARVGPGDLGIATAGYAAAAAGERRHQEAEAVRLLYVAATRARDILILPTALPRQAARTYAGLIREALTPESGSPEGEHRARITVALPQDAPPPPQKPAWTEPAAPGGHEGPTPPSPPLPEGPLVINPGRLGQPDDGPRGGGERTRRPDAAGGRARRVGSAFHAAMRLIFLDPDPPDPQVAAATAARCHAADETEVQQLVADCLRLPEIRRALQAARRWTEVPVALLEDGAFIEGYADLVIEGAAGVEIFEYKTDDLTPEQARDGARGYLPQAAAYALALARTAPGPVSGVHLIFVRPGVCVFFPQQELNEAGRGLLPSAPPTPSASP